MSRPSHDPSIFDEPHFQQRPHQLDPSEAAAIPDADADSPLNDVENTVWEEPTLAPNLAGAAPADQLTYARWLDQRIAETSYAKSLLVTLGLILAAGPWGILGALLGGGGGALNGIILISIIGPVTEEITKIALTLWVVEKRAYLFKSIWQILVASAAGGLLFGVIENLVYLNIYIPDATPRLAAWRWRVCTGLHLNCSFVAGVGLARIWDHAIRNRCRPQIGRGMPWFFIAMLGHGLYNFSVTVGESMGWLDFDVAPTISEPK